MKRFAITFAAVLVCLCVLSVQADKSESKKAEAPTRVYAPFHKIDLDREQKLQVAAIQAEIRAKIEQLEQEERRRVLAVFNDEQKAAFAQQEEAERAKRAAYAKEYRERKAKEAAAKAKAKGKGKGKQ